MEPKPPSARKPRDLAFYETPDHVRTSSQIVNEARTALRTLRTSRPFTPREEQRTLFGKSSSRNPENRPPSAFSLGSHHFDGSDSRPVSGTRLSPLGVAVRAEVAESVVIVPRPPPDPNRPVTRKASRQRLQKQSSVEGSPVKDEALSMKRINSSGSLQDYGNASPSLSRRVHSGPKERTQPFEDVEDKTETSPRRSSLQDVTSPMKSGRKVDSGYDSRGESGESRNRSSAGSAGKKDTVETEEEALCYNKFIGPIVEKTALHVKDKDAQALLELSKKLYNVLEERQMLGRACKRRSAILKILYKCLDNNDPQLAIRIARLILALKVSGNNLLSVSKLVFKAAKNEKYDHIFIQEDIIGIFLDALRGMDPVANLDALFYSLGAIKCLSVNSELLKKFTEKGCIEVLAVILKIVNLAKTGEAQSTDFGHTLVQLTGGLRNLADSSSSCRKFIESELVQELCVLMELYPNDPDLMLNVSRIFSKLTTHHECCVSLSSQSSCFESFLDLLNRHKARDDLVVRISFILGNLTAKSEESRTALFNTENALNILLAVFKTYIEIDIKNCDTNRNAKPKMNEDSGPDKMEDVLIKLIRVIANLSISEEIGPILAAQENLVDWLLHIIDSKGVSKSEDLVLNTVVTINNLSYYPNKDSVVTMKQTIVADTLLKLLMTDNMDGMVEVSRVFGNLTREKPVRDFLAKNKVTEIMVALLDSGSREIVYSACGVLINLMADDERRCILSAENGVAKLVEVIRDFGPTDWQLASLVCQILWNYSSRIISANATFGEQECQELSDLLIEYLDEDAALNTSTMQDMDETMQEFMSEIWETEFCPVGQQLLKRIEAHQSEFEPLEALSS